MTVPNTSPHHLNVTLAVHPPPLSFSTIFTVSAFVLLLLLLIFAVNQQGVGVITASESRDGV